jgi:hypothetical protein
MEDAGWSVMNILRYWPYVLGLGVLIAGLYFGLSWIKKRNAAESYDLNKDLESLGLDSEDEGSDVAGPHVANMYADQQGEGDAEIELDSETGGPDEMKPMTDQSGDDEVTEDIEIDTTLPDGSPESGDEEITIESGDDDEFALSEVKKAKVREMHADGHSVREIAETLGLGQDEVRMAINLAESES